jgi:hypothetical protein
MSGSDGVSDGSQVALGADVATELYGVTGAGVKIGIISNGYNVDGGAAADVAAGYLPANVTVLSDLPAGSDNRDEGRAMTELAYKIAPGATYYYATGYATMGDTTLQNFADAVTSLQDAGCNIIIDDLGFGSEEAYYQTGTVLDNAISDAIADGVNYFSAAGNDGGGYYEQGFTPLSTSIAGIGPVTANDFGGGSPYLPITIDKDATLSITFAWAQPFATIGPSGAGAQNNLALALVDSQGNIVASAALDELGENPYLGLGFENKTESTNFRLVVYQDGGTVPSAELFKIIVGTDNGVTIDSPSAGTGSGDIYGHQLVPGVNAVGAVGYQSTPAFGVSPAVPESFSSYGPGTIIYDSAGNPLPAAVSANVPTFVSVDGSSTSVPTFSAFYGTSAAAPNAGAVAALLLQANAALSTAEVTALLAQSAIPVGTTVANAGAGLIQARAGVELATAAGGTVWSNPAGGNWAAATNWSTGMAPGSSAPAMLSNDLGAFTASYTVTVNSRDTAGSLTLSAPAGSSVGLVIDSGGQLAIGGPSTDNRTAGDFLVAGSGTLSLDGGALTVAGSLNVNNGTVSLLDGQASAANYTQDAGMITVGGGSGAANLTLSDSTGISQTGGSTAILADGTIATTNASYSASSLNLTDARATFSASGSVVFTGSTLSDAGTITAGALSLYSTPTAILQTGSLTAESLAIGASSTTSLASNVTLAGDLIDAGALMGGTLGPAGTIVVQGTGRFDIGGATTAVSIGVVGDALIDFTSDETSVLTEQLNAVIGDFANGNGVIEFGALTYNPDDSYSYSDGDLTILDGSADIAALALDPDAYYAGFDLQPGTDGQLDVTVAPCFAAGTRIFTDRGAVAVEALMVGDGILTVDGTVEPVIWLGSRRVDCRRHARPREVLPVRIAAHAFGVNRPARDLFLSPDHAILWDGVLIPVKHLVDGEQIRQVWVPRVTYFHVELSRHSAIFAEGLPAESYLDTGDRRSFTQGSAFEDLHPAWEEERGDRFLLFDALGYAPLRVCGPEVVGAQRRQRHMTETVSCIHR